MTSQCSSTSLLEGADIDTSTVGRVRQLRRAGDLLSAFAAGDGTRLHGHLAAGLIDGDAAMVLAVLGVARQAMQDAAHLRGVDDDVYRERLISFLQEHTTRAEVTTP